MFIITSNRWYFSSELVIQIAMLLYGQRARDRRKIVRRQWCHRIYSTLLTNEYQVVKINLSTIVTIWLHTLPSCRPSYHISGNVYSSHRRHGYLYPRGHVCMWIRFLLSKRQQTIIKKKRTEKTTTQYSQVLIIVLREIHFTLSTLSWHHLGKKKQKKKNELSCCYIDKLAHCLFLHSFYHLIIVNGSTLIDDW